ncbi:MAG: T9SS type A sorting domain-containing protein [Candidatus Cloacimonetes bacterium]|nr:T9SS type A sorting domain-containing protein [Candidatus Cloacimonadota bacterium]
MKKIALFVFALALMLGAVSSAWATLLIDPDGDGGFESGTTFPSNGWTVVNNTQAGNKFQIGTATGSYDGYRCAFISNSATSWSNTNSVRYAHIYRNVSFPANETEITLTLYYRFNVASDGNDAFTVRMLSTSTTPTSSGYPAGDLVYPSVIYGPTDGGWYVMSISIPATYAGTTSRLCISWYNDTATPRSLGSLDLIELTSNVPATVSSFPYSTTMDPVEFTVSLPQGWTHLKSNAVPWRCTANSDIGSHSDPYIGIVSYNSSLPKNEWLISPPVSVVSGTEYLIKFWVKAPGWASDPEKLKVHWGTAPTVASFTANQPIYDNANMFISDWTEQTINFTAPTTGNIYFAWHAYSAANVDFIAIDDISITLANPVLTISEQEWDYGLAFANNSSCTPRSFTATNTGGGTINIPYGYVRLEGRDADQFTLTDNNTYPITLGGGQSASWSVKFTPTCEGEKIAQLVIEDSNGAKYIVAEVTPKTGSQVELVKADAFGPVQPRERSLDLTPISFEKQKPNPDTRKGTEPGINMQARQQITMPNSQDEKSHNHITMGQIIPADFSAKDSKSISLRGFGVSQVYEDYFEGYGHISHNLSPWTQYDGDQQPSTGIMIVDGPTLLESYTGSFIGVKYSGFGLNVPPLMTYSGDGYVACDAAQNTANDDWLISPKLNFGKNPRISFFAKSLYVAGHNPDRFNVLYSTTGNNPNDFAGNYLNSNSPQIVGSDWTVFEYRLPPECANNEVYVAIQCVSDNGFFLMVDDFVAGSSSCSMYAVQNGYWSNPDTWNTGTVPNSLDDVCLPDGMTVIVDSQYVSYQDNWSGAYSYTSQANAGSVTVYDGGELIIDSRAVLDVFGDLDNSGVITWNAGTASGGDYTTTLFVLGDLYNHETGTLNGAADHTNLYFNGDQAQTLSNDGSITGLIYNIGLENGYGLTLEGDNPIPVRRVNLFYGQMSNASQLILGSYLTIAVVQVGNLEQNSPAGSFDEHPSYHEDAFIYIIYASGNQSYSTGYEIPQDGIIDIMVVYMNSGDQYDLTMTGNIIISGAADQDQWEDEVTFINGRLYFDGYALIYNAEDFYISGGEGVYVDDFQVEIDTQTQYSIPGTVATYLHTWETYGTQNGGVEMNFYNPTEWGSAMYVDAYVSDDGGQTWTLYESNVPVTNSIATLDGVTDLGASTQTRIWAFANPSVPVELSSFTAAISADNFVNLMWVTQTETGVLGYYVLRGTENVLADAITVSELIPATNTSEQQSYIFKDSELFEDGYYYYWLQNSDMDGTVSFHGPIGIQFSTIGSGVPEIPLVTELKPVYPNPFNPMAYIPFSLKEAANVNFEIYNARGQLVKRIPLGQKAPGHYRTEWDGRDDQGRACGTGVYHIRMTAGNDSYLRKAVLMK